MNFWNYALFVVIILFSLSAIEFAAIEVSKALRSLETMGMPRTPYNVLLYLYCQVEAAQRINMEITMDFMSSLKKKVS